jgi:hypothetical protein
MASTVSAFDPTHETEDQVQLPPFSLLDNSNIDQIASDAAAKCNISTDDIQDIYPCTPLQQGLMALSIKQKGSYIAQEVIELPIEEDLERFKQAWDTSIDAFDILRTRIIQMPSSECFQIVSRMENTQWEKATSLSIFLARGEPVTMSFGNRLTGYAIVEDGPKRFFVWTLHHSLYDAWTMNLLKNAFRQAYHLFLLPAITLLNFVFSRLVPA